jgi:hypothetical protein
VHVSGHVVSHLGRCHAGPWSTREDTHTIRPCHRRRIAKPNLVSRWATPDASFRMGRVMERAQPTRRSSQTVSDKDQMGISDLVFLFSLKKTYFLFNFLDIANYLFHKHVKNHVLNSFYPRLHKIISI